MKKIYLFTILISLIILVGAGCNSNQKTSDPYQVSPTTQNSGLDYGQTNPQPEPANNNPVITPAAQSSTPPNTANKNIDLSKYKTPIMMIDQNKSYTAKMKTTAGEIDIELHAKATPITANNFVFLAKKNFYDNVIFHRAVKGFMIQGGDPTGTGAGGPGYKFNDEPFEGSYSRGTVAMANSGPNTNGSQFFIMHADNALPPLYVIFGKVIKGLDVVDKIAEAPVTMNEGGEMSKPVNPVKILSVEIIEK
jgi:cyclophilin family peptidyl-prolyl cis-trans isomerase